MDTDELASEYADQNVPPTGVEVEKNTISNVFGSLVLFFLMTVVIFVQSFPPDWQPTATGQVQSLLPAELVQVGTVGFFLDNFDKLHESSVYRMLSLSFCFIYQQFSVEL